MPLTIGRRSSLQAVEEAVRHQLPIGIVVQKDPAVEAPQIKDLYEIGTTAEVLRMSPSRDTQRQLIVQGRQRFRIVEFLQTHPRSRARDSVVRGKRATDQGVRGENHAPARAGLQSILPANPANSTACIPRCLPTTLAPTPTSTRCTGGKGAGSSGWTVQWPPCGPPVATCRRPTGASVPFRLRMPPRRTAFRCGHERSDAVDWRQLAPERPMARLGAPWRLHNTGGTSHHPRDGRTRWRWVPAFCGWRGCP